MHKNNYLKPPYNINSQILHLKEHYNIKIDNEDFARRFLSNNYYYRLRGYWYFLEEIENKKKISFKEIVNLYLFDGEIRKLLFPFLEKIEISIKSNFVNVLSVQTKDAFFYLKNEYFNNLNYHNEFLEKIEILLEKNKNEPFIKHFTEKYKEKHPPVWMITELLTFGEISKLYSNLKKEYLKEIANIYNIHYKCLKNYLVLLTKVRNIVFHHMRFWNRKFTGVSPRCIDNNNNLFLKQVLDIVNIFNENIDERFEFEKYINDLLDKYELLDKKFYMGL